jgi:phytoene synthase
MDSKPPSFSAAAAKTDKGENFPVASFLLRRELRGPVLAFYRFVRQADDIADSPDLSPEDKLAELDRLERALDAADPVEPAAAALAEVGARYLEGPAQARRMLDAFRQDATKRRYADWDDLLGYCERSANPVGRFLLRLHREDASADPPADALCTALQILNHLQDLVPDRERLGRIYLPEPWMDEAGGEALFFAPGPSQARRAVLDAALDRIDDLIDEAERLVSALSSRRLAAESAVTIALARRLAARLRADDPVLGRVALTPYDFACAFPLGAVRAARLGARDAALTRRRVARSGSSFKLGMASLSGERRRAIYAVYAYCRTVDDIADGAAPAEEKRRAFAAWRAELRGLSPRSATPIARELAHAVGRFALPVEELHTLLDGMESDAGTVRVRDGAQLDLYCRRVAGAAGVLSVHVFGVPEATDFAVALGRTLQLVNILRDVDEDAAIDRVYVPLSRLRGAAPTASAQELVTHADFPSACAALAHDAEAGFAAAERALDDFDRRLLRPAVVMMHAYRLLFDRMRAHGWEHRTGRPKLSRTDKLHLLGLMVSSRFAPALATRIMRIGGGERGRGHIASGLAEGEGIVARAGTLLRDGDVIRPIAAPGDAQAAKPEARE